MLDITGATGVSSLDILISIFDSSVYTQNLYSLLPWQHFLHFLPTGTLEGLPGFYHNCT